MKGTEELLLDAFELTKDLGDRLKKNDRMEDAQYEVCVERIDRAMYNLQQHVKKSLLK